jgi:hypothetical protein
MYYRATFISALSVLILAMAPSANSAEQELLSRIPAEFQGRWVMKMDQCEAPTEGWLDISAQKLNFSGGNANVVSAHRIGDLELEVDMNVQAKSREGWRQVRRYTLSQDMRMLTETRSPGANIVRVRCN